MALCLLNNKYTLKATDPGILLSLIDIGIYSTCFSIWDCADFVVPFVQICRFTLTRSHSWESHQDGCGWLGSGGSWDSSVWGSKQPGTPSRWSVEVKQGEQFISYRDRDLEMNPTSIGNHGRKFVAQVCEHCWVPWREMGAGEISEKSVKRTLHPFN